MLHQISLLFTFVFGLVTFALGVSAIVKANNEKSVLKRSVSPPTTVDINTDDILGAGASATAAAGLAALSALLFLLLPFVFTTTTRRVHRLRSLALAFFSLWLFASLVPFTLFFATRSARVTASVGSVTLPPQAIQAVEDLLGASPVYARKHYLLLFAVVPWFSLLFTALASVVSFFTPDRHSTGAPSDNEKHAVEQDDSPTA